jgi:hypothetical protein
MSKLEHVEMSALGQNTPHFGEAFEKLKPKDTSASTKGQSEGFPSAYTVGAAFKAAEKYLPEAANPDKWKATNPEQQRLLQQLKSAREESPPLGFIDGVVAKGTIKPINEFYEQKGLGDPGLKEIGPNDVAFAGSFAISGPWRASKTTLAGC